MSISNATKHNIIDTLSSISILFITLYLNQFEGFPPTVTALIALFTSTNLMCVLIRVICKNAEIPNERLDD